MTPACSQPARPPPAHRGQQNETRSTRHSHTHFSSPRRRPPFSLPSASSALPLLSPPNSFALCQSPAAGPQQHPCAVRAISAASGHSNATHQACVSEQGKGSQPARANPTLARLPSPPEREHLLSDYCLPALALAQLLLLLLSTSITTAGPSGLVVDTLLAASRLHALHLRHCPALPAWLCWIAPAAFESTPTTAFRPALPHSSHSQDCAVPQPGSDSTPRRTHRQPARAVHSLPTYLSHRLSARHQRTVAACDPA